MEVHELPEFQAFSECLNGTLLDGFQTVDILRTLLRVVDNKPVILTQDTGLGKTLIVSGVMRLLVNEVPARRFIMFVEFNQLNQTPADLRKYTGLSVLAMQATQQDIEDKLLGRDFLRYQVLMLTHDCLNNPMIMNILYQNKEAYYGIIVDEAHRLSNFESSSSAFMMRAILRNYKCRIGMSATTITSNVKQLADLAYMFDWENYSDRAELTRQMNGGYSPIKTDPYYFINRRRKDLGMEATYDKYIHKVPPMPHQTPEVLGKRKVPGSDLMRLMKGKGATNQVKKLVNLILSARPDQGLVYIREHAIREWVLPFLDEVGIKYACINGRTSLRERGHIQQKFKEGKYDVVITSVTRSLNLPADYIVFYEYCNDIQQMLGRAHRGLNPKAIALHFIFTQGTAEIEHFLEYSYRRSILWQEILGKDYSELIAVGDKLLTEG